MPKSTTNPLDRLFAALADATRRDVIARLAADGVATVSALAHPYAMALPSFTQHLEVLERADLIVKTKIGRERHVTFRQDRLDPVNAWLAGLTSPTALVLATTVVRAEPELAPPSPRPEGAEALLAKARTLARELAPSFAIIERALAASPHDDLATRFSPTAHAARRLVAILRDAPALATELREVLALFQLLRMQLAAVERGGAVDPLKATCLPLGRYAFIWRHHPLLADILAVQADVSVA